MNATLSNYIELTASDLKFLAFAKISTAADERPDTLPQTEKPTPLEMHLALYEAGWLMRRTWRRQLRYRDPLCGAWMPVQCAYELWRRRSGL